MPELPEVETVRSGLEPHIVGKHIANVTLNRPNLRIPFPNDFVEKLVGAKIESVGRRAKYLLVHLQNDILMIHLGMSGKLTIEKSLYKEQKHDHVLIELDGNMLLVYNDPRRFGLMTIIGKDEVETHKLLSHFAPEPLGNGFSEAYLSDKLKGRKTPIKTLLMDNRAVVGVGNIYACETLWRCGIHPQKAAGDCVGKAGELVATIRDVLAEAIKAGGSTLKDYATVDGNAGYFQHQFNVYGRAGESCNRCDGKVERIVQAGRSTFFCGGCQE